jgi:5-methylcytosine-specific restriction enzyme subunit McrC
MFLLSYGPRRVQWHDPLVEVEKASDLFTSVAVVFVRLAEQALLRGLLQGYRTIEEHLPVVRGRIQEAEQIRRRFALMVPVEVRYDDFTVDTAENRWLRAAVVRLARLPGVDPRTRHRLRRLDLMLSDVTAVTSVHQLEPWSVTRLNARYHDALRLAEVIVRSASFEQAGEGLRVSGFVLDMAQVFEDFVCTALGASLVAADGGRTVSQDRRWALDAAHEVALRPDLVWDWPDGRPRAVIDAKYKAEKPSGFPDADLYQLLAYCTALRLPDGHLVYAQGNEAGRTHLVPGAGVTLHAHTLNLDKPPAGLLAQVDALAATLADTTTASVSASV